tara:strand:- start:143 stop:886 length:744 start_codon:yes stop_codon:yes gene_type:complete
MVSFLKRISSFRRTVDNVRLGELILKLSDFHIKQYQCPKPIADKLRQALIECEGTILDLPGQTSHKYPKDTITGKMNYYNLVRDEETWFTYGLPFIKEIVVEYLSLKPDEEVAIKAWGNILRMDRKVYPHRHFGVPDDWVENKQSVCGNIFLGAEVATATTYILDGDKVDIPNVYGQFTLFPPNISHAVRTYKGEGVRVSAAFDTLVTSRDKEGKVTGKNWMTWVHQKYQQQIFAVPTKDKNNDNFN